MNNDFIYPSREAAGEILAQKLRSLNLNKPFLIAIPRGGIQVAEAIADEFKIPVNTIITKKLPIPESPEAGFGAISEEGEKILDEETASYLGLSDSDIEGISKKVIEDIKHRTQIYGSVDKNKVRSSDVIVVDDGVATGYSLIAALKSIRKMNPNSITAAVPVSSEEAYHKILRYADNVVCPLIARSVFFAVAAYYKEWYDLSETQIQKILKKYREKYSD